MFGVSTCEILVTFIGTLRLGVWQSLAAWSVVLWTDACGMF